MHHKQESVTMLSTILPDNGHARAPWSGYKRVLRIAAWRDNVDVAVRAGQYAGNRTAGPETQYPLHHGR